MGYKRHKYLERYSQLGSVSLHSTEMQKLFRKGDDGGYYKKVIYHYFDVVDDKYRFSPYGSYTKKYKLKSWVTDCLLEDDRRIRSEILSGDLVPNYANRIGLLSGVKEFDYAGNPTKSKFHLPSSLAINFDRVMSEIENIESQPAHTLNAYTNLYNLLQLYYWMEAFAEKSDGTAIPQLYIESLNGRLVGIFEDEIPHIINTPKRIRKVLMGGMGLVDYDISNCHFTIFSHISKQLGLETPMVDVYIDNSSMLRESWTEEFNLNMKSLKPYLLSWLYGNTNREILANAFSNEIDLDTLSLMRNDTLLSGIYEEILSNRPIIIDSATTADGLLENRMGKQKKPAKAGKNLSFLFFGWESKIMETINHHIGDEMKALIYDGWIGTEVDMAEIEQVVHEELGISIQLHDEPFE